MSASRKDKWLEDVFLYNNCTVNAARVVLDYSKSGAYGSSIFRAKLRCHELGPLPGWTRTWSALPSDDRPRVQLDRDEKETRKVPEYRRMGWTDGAFLVSTSATTFNG